MFFPIAFPTFISLDDAFDQYGGVAPPAVVTGDLRGDGKLDLVLTSAVNGTVSVLLGNGDGTFQNQVEYSVGEAPGLVAIADFNGDGRLDLAVTNTKSNTVSILLGNGDGTFQPEVQYAAGAGAYGIAAADVNGDGKLDLVVTNSGVSVLLGNGDGTFQAATDFAVGADPRSVAVGDFNRDGNLDLAVANSESNNVSVLLGNGDGTFSTPTSYATGSGPLFLTAADFNGDDKLDLAVMNQSENTISILLGNGDGTFQREVSYPAPDDPTFMGVADLNGDGKLDLAVGNNQIIFYATCASILLGNGDGTFQPPVNYSDNQQPCIQLAIGDFNGDGKLDLAGLFQSENLAVVMLQNGTVNLSPASISFGNQLLGSSSPAETVTLTNVGTSTLTISSIAITGSGTKDFSKKNKCGASLLPGRHCDITVTFTPAQLGPLTAALTFTDNAPGSPQAIPLSGFGVTSGPNATLSASSLTFATQLLNTTSAAQSVTLSNYGSATLDITSIVATGNFVQTNTCGPTIAPEASCTIQVTFTPTAAGNLSGTLSFTNNAPGSPQSVNLSGVGTVVDLNPSKLSFFGNGQKTTTLTNVGSAALTITSIVITGSDKFSQTNTCGSSVGAGGSCTITVTWSEGKESTGDVSITDNGGGSPQEVPLSGQPTRQP